jgi:hypothetical protein
MRHAEKLSYLKIAEHYGVTLEELSRPDWVDRQVRHQGLRQFLVHIWGYRLSKLARMPDDDWQFLWMGNVWASKEALKVWHKRIPKKLADMDRARVAAILARRGGMLDGTGAAAKKWAKQREL